MSQFKEWDLQVFDTRRKSYVNDSTGVGVVMVTGTPALVTVKADQQGTSLTQPITLNSGRLRFFTAKTVTSVDISILTSTGQAIFASAVDSSVHRLDVNPEERHQLLVLPAIFNAGGTVTDTGFDLPANLLITDAFVRVTTVDATETVDVGLLAGEAGGDENGFLSLVSVANAGFVHTGGAVNNGATSDFFDAVTYGVLLASFINGSDAAATSGGVVRRSHLTDGIAKSITYTPSGSDTFAGYIYLSFLKLVGV